MKTVHAAWIPIFLMLSINVSPAQVKYPSKPVRIVAASSAGSGIDFISKRS